MNIGVSSVRRNRVTIVAMAMVMIGGVISYFQLGRLEDPEFTIKEALIITPYPGASAEEVAQEVTNPIEAAVQELSQLERVESQSVRGRSIVTAVVQDRFQADLIPQVWDELRRKINDVQPRLPPSVRGSSMVVDDFGDVYGIFLAITGEGYTPAELRRYAEFLRRDILLIDDVKKVELFAAQREVVYVEISRRRLAQLGINEDQIYAALQAKNIAADGGRVRVGEEYIAIDPYESFGAAEDMLDLVVGADATGRQLFLRDLATVTRQYEQPPRRILRFDGQPAVGLGISTSPGGNVVTMGNRVRERLEALREHQPLGVEIGEINFQSRAVVEATNDFVGNLLLAVVIVSVTLLFAMGLRPGFKIGLVLLMTILATLVFMNAADMMMERISLGAFIIALCMLTDNAIVIAEGMKVRIEAGEDKLEVIRSVVAQNQWPLLGATAIAVVAFSAIGLSEHSTGEYSNSLFWVIAISLPISWVAAITATPLLGYALFKARADGAAAADPYAGRMFRVYRSLLIASLRWRWAVVGACVVMLIAAVFGFRRVEQSFFPPATRPQFMVDVFLPAGTHIRETEAFASDMESYMLGLTGVTHVSSFIGGGGLRFLLVYSPEPENRAFVQFLVNVEDEDEIDGLMVQIQGRLDGQMPDANAIAKKFLLGPGKGGRIQVRLSGPDPQELRRYSDQVKAILRADGGAIGVRDDWREKEKVIRPRTLEQQARRAGVTRADIARAIETSFEGRTVGFYREPGGVGGGVFPQEARLLPIIARPPEAERLDVGALRDVQIWSPTAGRMIPLSQVMAEMEVAWEDSAVMRRNRFPTLTVHADPRSGLPSALFNRVRGPIEAMQLSDGYTMEWGGEHEDSTNARQALAGPLPMTLVLMVFIVLCIFNSVRATVVICLTVPLILVGVTGGLLLTRQAFGFMALLGVIALAGQQIKNAIVLLDEYAIRARKGEAPYDVVVNGSISRLRPVVLVVVTTVLGMLPLVRDPFFAAMSVAIIFGLAFAAVLTMIVVPVLYTIFFRIDTRPRA
ncbi:MAG: efflux RND transporter permease subunit [Phycisphaerales bacterium]|nr:efflux RND transporter permease subunit [Phycisphaerales bacterium]